MLMYRCEKHYQAGPENSCPKCDQEAVKRPLDRVVICQEFLRLIRLEREIKTRLKDVQAQMYELSREKHVKELIFWREVEK